ILNPLMADQAHEEFWILLLNRANLVTESMKISTGGLTGTTADVRMIFNHAIKGHATGIILCHNHPSGNLKPSQLDIDLTKKIKEAGRLLEIPVLDHLIIADNKFFSLADEGLL